MPTGSAMQASMWVMRHATSGPTTDAAYDDSRPLNPDGIKEAKAAGVALKRLQTPIQAVLSSSLVRGKQTAEIVAGELGLDVVTEKRLNGQPIEPDEIKEICRDRGNCLLVTHSPSCNLIVFKLTGAQCQLTKGGLAQIHEGEVWTILNASTCMVMADMVDFKAPHEVDSRSGDDEWLNNAPRPPRRWYQL